MNYEEKYKEALEDIRAIYPNLKGDAKLAVEHAFPELRESEDERIRKALIETVKCIYAGDTMFLSEQQRDRYLAYLEKQKEQKPNFSEKDSTDFEIEVHEIIAQARNDSRLDDADVLKQFEEEAAFALMLKANKLIEQKPAEWSEEDIKKIRSEEYTKGFNDAAFVGKIKEWSVEDEDRIRQIERIAQEAGCTQKLQEEIHDWLKSIRKQAKPECSEEDEKMLQSIIEDFRAGKVSTIGQEQWLKSLRPSWKPSKEQMEALNVLNLHGDLSYVGQQNQLISLYNDLKKLM